MPRLRVAVCTNRIVPVLRECLEALRGTDVLLVASGADSGLRTALAAAASDARLLCEPRSGLSRARNRALAESDDDEVLAFVDDDVVVGPGWADALRAAWKAAGPDVVCIGGPIRLRFTAPPPGWLSDPLLPALCRLDYGAAAQDLDPSVRTVYGGNASFRCGALRAVGGFDPAFGHQGARAWFSEEDEVQRALVRAGGRVRYEPAAWVEHVIAPERLRPGWFAGRRFRYGATLGSWGGRSRS